MNLMALKMVWLQFLGFQFVLPILAYTVLGYNQFDFSNEALMHSTSLGFAVVSLLTFCLAFLVPKLIASKKKPQLHSTAPTPTRNSDNIKNAFQPYIIRIALLEFSGIFGFVVTLITTNPAFVVMGAVLSIIGMLQSKPSRDVLERLS